MDQIPCRVEQDLRRYEAQAVAVHESDRQYAREELIGKLIDGKRVGGIDLGGLIDCAYNEDFDSVCAKLHGFLAGLEHASHDEASLRTFDMSQWARKLATDWIDSRPDLIDERAAEIAEEE